MINPLLFSLVLVLIVIVIIKINIDSNNLAVVPELPAFNIKFFLNLYPNKPLPKTSHLELLRLILIPNFFILLIALTTSSDLSMFDAELLPLLNDESIMNLILKDLSPSTFIDFFLKV